MAAIEGVDTPFDQIQESTTVLNSSRVKTAVFAAVAAAALAAPAHAGSQSSPLTVNATVTGNCSISTSPLNFGSVDTLSGSPVVGTGGITITCTSGTGWSAAADAGAGSGATLAVRRMTSSGNTLNYVLYTDSNRTTVWGDGSGSTAAITNTGSGSAQSVTIYGRVPAGQTGVPAGSYTDTVGVTVTY